MSNIIATAPIINNNTTLLLLLSQAYMFNGAKAFNQHISGWNIGSSGTNFVSDLGLWESLSSCCFRLLSSRTIAAVVTILERMLYCPCILYYNHVHNQHEQTKPNKVSHTSSVSIMKNNISPLSCFHRIACSEERRALINRLSIVIGKATIVSRIMVTPTFVVEP